MPPCSSRPTGFRVMRYVRRLLMFAVLLVPSAFPAVAAADALVIVEVRAAQGAPRDGLVTLTPRRGGSAYSCTTRNGSCRINGVRGGSYVVTFSPSGAPSRRLPQPAMIPPDGTVQLVVPAG
jgi:hypothetical protein